MENPLFVLRVAIDGRQDAALVVVSVELHLIRKGEVLRQFRSRLDQLFRIRDMQPVIVELA